MNNHRMICTGPLVYERVNNRFEPPEILVRGRNSWVIRKYWIGDFYFGLDMNTYTSGRKVRWILSTWVPHFLRQNYRSMCKEYNYHEQTRSILVSKPVLMG